MSFEPGTKTDGGCFKYKVSRVVEKGSEDNIALLATTTNFFT
jgi:hypothetical protein